MEAEKLERGYDPGRGLFGVCFAAGPGAKYVVLCWRSVGGLTKSVVECDQVGGAVEALLEEGCVYDPNIQWTIQINTLASLWDAALRRGYGSAGDGACLPLARVSAIMGQDDYCALFCISRAGADHKGNPLVSERVLEDMRDYFGSDVQVAMATLRDVTEKDWFLSSTAAFERHCEEEAKQVKAGYSADEHALFGVFFGDKAPQ